MAKIPAPALRAAIYARYSSDEQRPESIEDQVERCRRYCTDHGWVVVAVYSDAAMTGKASRRPDFARLQRDSQNRMFDIVVVEALDRLSRRLADTARFYDNINFNGQKLVTCDRGEINGLLIGILGAIGQSFLEDLRHKTRRGLSGRILKGLSAGGIGYGYRADPANPGVRSIDEDKAAVIRRIFQLYAAGASPRAIAALLNKEGVPGPRGRPWSDTTIRGQVDRGTGILNNSVYNGVLEWNRCSYIFDPTTEKRTARPNPADQRESVSVPHLRIIDAELWEKVKARQAEVRTEMERNENGQPLNRAHRGKYVLSGLIFCGECGKPFALKDKRNYMCSTFRSGGNCANHQLAPRKDLEGVVAEALRRQFLTTTRVEDAYRQIIEIAETATGQEKSEREQLVAKGKRTKDGIRRLVDVIVDGAGDSRALKDKLVELEAEAEAISARINEIDSATEELEPFDRETVAAFLNDTVNHIEDIFNDPDSHLFYELHALVRRLIDKIVVPSSPTNLPNPSYEMHGIMVGLLEAAGLLTGPKNGEIPESALSGISLSVVAGTGFEPVTFRL